MGLRMENFDIFRVHRKIRFLVGGVYKKQIFRGDCRKRIGLDSLQIKGGLGKIEGERCFWGGSWYPSDRARMYGE